MVNVAPTCVSAVYSKRTPMSTKPGRTMAIYTCIAATLLSMVKVFLCGISNFVVLHVGVGSVQAGSRDSAV